MDSLVEIVEKPEGVYEQHLLPGTHISDAASEACARADATGADVFFCFNGIPLLVRAGALSENVADAWEVERSKREKLFKESPGYAEWKSWRDSDRSVKRRLLTREIVDLVEGRIDMKDRGQVIDFFVRIQDATDTVGVAEDVDVELIVRKLRLAGYDAGACTVDSENGEVFDADDPDLYARWLVGQCLDNLMQMRAVHHVVHKFAKEWHSKFDGAGT